MPCEVVVQTVYGLTRCTAPSAQLTEDDLGREIQVCEFHHSNPTLPRCVTILRSGVGLRCQLAALMPTENPQYCQDCWSDVQSRELLEAERRRFRARQEEIRRSSLQFFTADLGTPQVPVPHEDPPPVQPFIGEPITDIPMLDLENVWAWQPDESYQTDPMNHRIPRREEIMPSVGFSQAAMPFVAALVQRLGGEVTVPARRLERGEVLAINRVTGGLRLSIMRGREVVRTPDVSPIPVPALIPPPVQTKYEIEKVRDEEEFELRKTLQKCPECGLQFEKAHKKPDGKDECPYCEIRRIESGDMSSELKTLTDALAIANGEVIGWKDRASRFERMLQEKLELVSRKSTEIKQLKIVLEQSTQASAAGSRLNAIQEMRAAAQAKSVRGGLRVKIEQALAGTGAVIRSHSTTTHSQEAMECHQFEIYAPLRSQLESP